MNRNDCLEANSTKPNAGCEGFLADVIAGLSQDRKTLPSKYFYDQRGSQLFDQICQLEEYYPTRTEVEIMRSNASEMSEALGGPVTLIEFGSGSSVKTEFLLKELPDLDTYIPVDISAEHLAAIGRAVQQRHQTLNVQPLATDFTQLDSVPSYLGAKQPRHVYFPGSTIGNFESDQATGLLCNIANIIGADGSLLLGFDLVKKISVLESAYNDASGVTAAFNKNVLHRINVELGGDFDFEAFDHEAIWNGDESRIEMHLRSNSDQTVAIADQSFRFREGESICTEYSHKYDLSGIERLAALAGLELCDHWTDPQGWFAVASFRSGQGE